MSLTHSPTRRLPRLLSQIINIWALNWSFSKSAIHHSPWEVRIRDNVPEFIPPEWLNADRRPLRNPLRQ